MKHNATTLLNYPLKYTEISLYNRNIQLKIVDEPDRFLQKLSREDNEGRLVLPYWTYLWESSIGLAQYVLKISTTLSNKHTLEIGCGFGLAGIVACQMGAKVVFTDFEHDALRFAQVNTQQNFTSSATFVQMDWTTPCFRCKFDVILASDVIYEEQNWQPILCLLQSHLAHQGIAVFSEPCRKNADGFFECIREGGFAFKKSIQAISLDQKTTQINIIEVKRVE